ncbi:MAG TPA: glycerophosphodiester phosphodiesterase family protein [Acidimicrobiia bacterium]|nr:glycerophosphodiester phosphodiesterase family protein [Acidimicrobiia bacterium]
MTPKPVRACRRPFFDWPHPIPFAHRGGAAEWPENTMRAFSSAVGLGYRHLETDVRVTADGVAVAFHDQCLDRVADRSGRLHDLPFHEIRRARVDGEPIPRLEEVLGAWPDVFVYIDAKADAAVVPLLAAIDRTAAHDRVCVGAFSIRRVHHLRRLGGARLGTWMASSEILRLRLTSLRLPLPRFAPAVSATQVPVRHGPVRLIDRRFIDEAHRRGIAVHASTIDDRPEIERLLDLGVDGILSNRPTLLRSVFMDRGIWAG